ncbi:MAG: helix-turn-helix transcriptional regulator, partial [Chloroflexi bacterium]|nr:helix-turn-helix transcriptional regulator [Chloroflexota bacterium]
MLPQSAGSSAAAESFRDLLLRYRGRTRLTQRELADRVGVNRRSVQEWENGANYPSAERLEALVRVFLEVGAFTAGHEVGEAQALWAAVQRQAPHTHAPFDAEWFARLLSERAAPAPALVPLGANGPPHDVATSQVVPVERRQDWGEAPDPTGFVGRADELLTL